MTPAPQQVLTALDGNESILTIARRMHVTRNTLHNIATENGYDWEGRKARIRKSGTDKRIASMKLKAKRVADEAVTKWLRGERTMSGDMGSLMGLRGKWV